MHISDSGIVPVRACGLLLDGCIHSFIGLDFSWRWRERERVWGIYGW